MRRFTKSKLVAASAVLALASSAHSAFACAACYGGKTDSPLAAGMNWGIMALLVVVVGVLGLVSSFFIYLSKKAAEAGKAVVADPPQGALAKAISEV